MATVDPDRVLLTAAGKPARVPDDIAQYFFSDQPFTRNRIVLPRPRAR